MHIIQDIHILGHYIFVKKAIKYSTYMVQLILIGTVGIIGYTWTYRCQGYVNHSVRRSPEGIDQWYMIIISYKNLIFIRELTVISREVVIGRFVEFTIAWN